jgi:hypothetical protein
MPKKNHFFIYLVTTTNTLIDFFLKTWRGFKKKIYLLKYYYFLLNLL